MGMVIVRVMVFEDGCMHSPPVWATCGGCSRGCLWGLLFHFCVLLVPFFWCLAEKLQILHFFLAPFTYFLGGWDYLFEELNCLNHRTGIHATWMPWGPLVVGVLEYPAWAGSLGQGVLGMVGSGSSMSNSVVVYLTAAGSDRLDTSTGLGCCWECILMGSYMDILLDSLCACWEGM